MNLLQALKWADVNAQGEVVDRLRSRKVAKVLSATVRTYAAWIREEGERSNTCTYNVLGEVCGYCECKRKASNAKSEQPAPLLAQVGSTDGLGVVVPSAPTLQNERN